MKDQSSMVLKGLLGRSIPPTTQIMIDADPVTVTVRVNARAKAYRLSVGRRGEPVLTVPRAGRWGEAQAFLERNSGWLANRLAKLATPHAIVPGGTIPLRGVPHTLVSLPSSRGLVRVVEGTDGPELHVPGGQDHMRRRLLDWLKAEARRDLQSSCARHAATLGVGVAGITMRDQSTRWGSCSSARTLNFNWRLVLAPDFVLDYVAAHEVAHIVEMNHSPAFWRTVARTLPDYGRGQAWLKAHGAGLMAI